VKVYQSIVDDPLFERVYDTPTLGTWLRMLLVADAMYPTTAPLGRRNPAINLLIEVGLVIVKPGNRYSMRGMEAERERRSDAGRNAAAVRWQSVRNADPMLVRAEQSRAEQTNGQSPPTFMGYRPKAGPPAERLPGEAFVPRHEGQHPDCAICATLKDAPSIEEQQAASLRGLGIDP
jgi:hypothetical protein